MLWLCLTTICMLSTFSISYEFNVSSICPEYPSCNCTPIGDKFSIGCSEVNNFTDVQILLEEYFMHRSIYKLQLVNCSVTSFPENVFDGFNITILDTDCPYEDIELNAVRHIADLHRLYFTSTTFNHIPIGLQNLTFIITEGFDSCNITELTTELRNLRSLSYFTIKKCTLHSVAEDAFVDNAEMVFLDLSRNNIKFIYADTFNPMKNLETVYLKGNLLLTIDGLFNKLNLLSIDVYNNSITNIDHAFQHIMQKLVFLDLGKNPIPFLNSTALKMMPALENLQLMANKFTGLDPSLLQTFIRLDKINLSYNKLLTIPDGFFHNLVNLEEIDLSSNRLVSVSRAFINNPKLNTLQLQYNAISSIENTFSGLPQLTSVRMYRNFLVEIHEEDLHNCPMLEDLDIGGNMLKVIHSRSFTKLKNLKLLKLNKNKFTHFNYSIKDLYSLTTLSSNNGLLIYIKDDEMTNLPKLQYLDLLNNNLESVDGAFRQLFSLEYLNLASNKLTTLTRDTFPEDIKLQELNIAKRNRFQCDCRLLWFIEYLHGSGKNVLKDEPMCHLPMRLRGVYFRNLTSDDLTEWPDGCFKPWCSCQCVPQNREFYVEADCSHGNLTSVPSTLPDHLGELDLQDNLIRNFSINSTELIKDLQILTLSDNKLHSLNASLPISLRVLSLDGNLFRRFPLEIISNISSLEIIKLSRNPWKCDCETVSFKKWLIASGKKVVDVNNTRCGDDEDNGIFRNLLIITLKDTQLCPTKLSVYIPIAIGSLVFLFFGASSLLLYYRHRQYIRVWLYAHGFTWVKEEELDADKPFDSYLSFADADQNFALFTIAAGLETVQPKFKLCIHERDIKAGEYSVVTVVTALTCCKRFIMILSKAYLEDEFAMQAFRDAFSLSLEDKVSRLIIIQRGKLPALSSMEPFMQTVLGATKPIVWRERMFWEKLRYSMPKKVNKKTTKLTDQKVEEMGEPSADNVQSIQELPDSGFQDDQRPLLTAEE